MKEVEKVIESAEKEFERIFGKEAPYKSAWMLGYLKGEYISLYYECQSLKNQLKENENENN